MIHYTWEYVQELPQLKLALLEIVKTHLREHGEWYFLEYLRQIDLALNAYGSRNDLFDIHVIAGQLWSEIVK